jgi:16S rRNA (cytosine1402-N4)-methyltransferase
MMRDRGTGRSGADGGLAPHIPVLARAVIEQLSPRDGGVYLDGTFGAGGHTRLILQAASCRVVSLDRDQSAIALGADLVAQSDGRLVLMQERFSEIESAVRANGVTHLDGILLDLGVSSMQLDQAERGFSFRNDGPLDMRMGRDGPSAADLVAHATERDLAAIIATLGEERFARAVARAIVRARADSPIETTGALADIISRVVRSKPGEIHPATRTFQALRMFVNDELGELATALQAAEQVLAPDGRLAVISFHSLEDRIVKQFFAQRGKAPAVSRHQPLIGGPAPSFRILTTKAIVADAEEIAENPRARSAKLRAGTRTDAAPMQLAVTGLPSLPSLDDVMRGC